MYTVYRKATVNMKKHTTLDVNACPIKPPEMFVKATRSSVYASFQAFTCHIPHWYHEGHCTQSCLQLPVTAPLFVSNLPENSPCHHMHIVIITRPLCQSSGRLTRLIISVILSSNSVKDTWARY